MLIVSREKDGAIAISADAVPEIELIKNPYSHMRKGELYAICGDTSVGKTSLLLQMATNIAYSGDDKPITIIFSAETCVLEKCFLRQVSNRDIDIHGLENLFLYSVRSISEVEYVLAHCKADVVAIDGTHYVVDAMYCGNQGSKAANVAKQLKSLAETYDVSVLFTAWKSRHYQSELTDSLIKAAAWSIELQGGGGRDGWREVLRLTRNDNDGELLGHAYFDGESRLFWNKKR